MLTDEVLYALLPPPDRRTLYVTIGNTLRSDDGVGPYIAEKLNEIPGLWVKDAGDRPERAMNWVLEMKPDFVVFLDAADFGASPGEVSVLAESSLVDTAFSTHRLPLAVILQWIEQESGAKCRCIGIQPDSMELGEGLSPAVQQAADKLIRWVKGDGNRKCCDMALF